MPLCALVPKMSRYMKNLIVLGAFAFDQRRKWIGKIQGNME